MGINLGEAGLKRKSLKFRLATFVGVVWTVYTLSYLLDVYLLLNISIFPVSHRAISTGLLTILVFLSKPLSEKVNQEKIQWYDLTFIFFTILGCGYIIFNADELIASGRIWANTFEIVLAAFFFLSLIEAIRRTTGWVISVLIILVFSMPFTATIFPGSLRGQDIPIPWV